MCFYLFILNDNWFLALLLFDWKALILFHRLKIFLNSTCQRCRLTILKQVRISRASKEEYLIRSALCEPGFVLALLNLVLSMALSQRASRVVLPVAFGTKVVIVLVSEEFVAIDTKFRLLMAFLDVFGFFQVAHGIGCIY